MKLRNFVGSAAVVALVLAGAGKGHHFPAVGGVPATVASVPLTGDGGQQQWARDFLAALGKPQTACNEAAIGAWEAAEGGGVTNDAANNPLDTTQPEPGDWSINSVGVKAYPSYSEGLQANVTAITNGLYGGILSALSAGNNGQAVADAIASSPWGTGPFGVAAC